MLIATIYPVTAMKFCMSHQAMERVVIYNTFTWFVAIGAF